MKVTKEVFEKMKSDIKVILDHYKLKTESIESISDSTLFAIWRKVYQNRYSPSEVKFNGVMQVNPNVDFNDVGERILERIDTFEFYPCDTNDNTLLTALRKATKELI